MQLLRHVAIVFLVWLGPVLAQEQPATPYATRRTPVVIAVEKVAPAVANISTERVEMRAYLKPRSGGRFYRTPDDIFDSLFDSFFGRLDYIPERVENPLGSGALIDEDGYVVTNQHVIRKASTLKITLYGDKRVYDATLISADPASDLAVLKINADHPFHYIRIGTSADLMLGETVIALGNPLGFATSISVGIVSAKDREITVGGMKYTGLIQTDAAINPGNSGGPLVNINGELIGINTAIVASAEGLGFAIPADKVRKTLAELFRFEETSKMRVGVEVEEPRIGEVSVRLVEADSPAWHSGLKPGDVIVKLDKEPIDSAFTFWKHLVKRNVGDTIVFTVKRGTESLRISLVAAPPLKPAAGKLAEAKMGASLRTVTPQLARRLGLMVKDGVVVEKVEPNGPADESGLQPNDVIAALAGYRVRTLDDLGVLLKYTRPGQTVTLTVIRGDEALYGPITLR